MRSSWIIQADINSGEDFRCQSWLTRKDEKFSNLDDIIVIQLNTIPH